MQTRNRILTPLLGFLGLAVVVPAWAQNELARPSYSRLLNIDALIDNHARFLARRYNLSEEQDAYTQAFLRQRTDAFLAKHREELFDLVDRLVEVRTGGQMEPQELIEWGKRALPLYQEAKQLIIEGNNEWRGILTEEQRKIHDEDLREMLESFATTEDQLQRIVSGQMDLEEFRRGPARQVPRNPTARMPLPAQAIARTAEAGQAPPPTAQPAPPEPTPADRPAGEGQLQPVPASPPAPAAPARPKLRKGAARSPGESGKPESGGPGLSGRTPARGPGSVPGGTEFESQWEAYVREFIQRYRLDEAQTQRANAILKDCQDQANRHIQRCKSELEQLDRKLTDLGQSKEGGKDKIKELSEINEQRNKLLAPINEIFEKQLKPRLERLPTRAQRQAAQQSGPGQPSPAKPARPSRKPPQPPPSPPAPPEEPPSEPDSPDSPPPE